MRVELVQQQLAQHGLAHAYLEFDTSSATVALAAQTIGCEEGRIAKTLAFITSTGPLVIVVMGTARIDNAKFKQRFHEKAKFPQGNQVLELTGHPIGGVCPFALNPNVAVYLDESLKAFDPVYPAAGASNNAVTITLAQLETVTGGEWVDVCK